MCGFAFFLIAMFICLWTCIAASHNHGLAFRETQSRACLALSGTQSAISVTIEHDIPLELDYLERHDLAMQGLMNAIEMPDAVASKFIMFTRQNKWTLPRNRRENEFRELTDDEVKKLESVVRMAFDGFPEDGIVKASN